MSIWGKIIGGTAGFALGGPLGALIGAVAGHAYDTYSRDKAQIEDRPSPSDATGSRQKPWTTKAEPTGAKPQADEPRSHAPQDEEGTRKIAFTIAVIVLGAKIAKADGRVTRDEVAAFRQVFKVPENEVKNVARVFNQARKDSAGFEPYARQVGRMFRGRPAVLEELLRCLFHIAKADGTVADTEITFLSRVANELGLDAASFTRLKAAELGSPKDDPFAILGVDPDDDEDRIKKAHRNLVREHHPDRLIAQGMPDEFVEGANDALAEVNAAYDQVRKLKGWS
ncbi:MAG: TerB family tellurite resistance protein [Pseudomonadota bacterium]